MTGSCTLSGLRYVSPDQPQPSKIGCPLAPSHGAAAGISWQPALEPACTSGRAVNPTSSCPCANAVLAKALQMTWPPLRHQDRHHHPKDGGSSVPVLFVVDVLDRNAIDPPGALVCFPTVHPLHRQGAHGAGGGMALCFLLLHACVFVARGQVGQCIYMRPRYSRFTWQQNKNNTHTLYSFVKRHS